MTDYQRFDELVSSAVRASSIINKVDILKNALDLYHGKVLSSADGEHWLIQFSTKYHLSYMGAVSELLRQLDSLHSYDLLNQYAMKSLTIAPDNPKAYCWLIRSLKAQGMNELATNELAAAKEHLHGLQRQRSQGRSVDEVLKHILSAKGHLQAADVPCYILKITIYRSDDTMVDKFSQVAGNVPVTNNDPNRRYTVINGYPVVLNFAKEPNPGVFERVRDILLATSYTKKTS